jgi:hypothetical protein
VEVLTKETKLIVLPMIFLPPYATMLEMLKKPKVLKKSRRVEEGSAIGAAGLLVQPRPPAAALN